MLKAMSEELICNITPPNSPVCVISNSLDEEYSDVDVYEQDFSFRWFVCLGEAKLEKIHLHDKSYIRCDEINLLGSINNDISKNIGCKTVSLFNFTFDLASMFLYESDMVFREVRKELLNLHDAAKSKRTLSDFHSTQDHVKARQNCIRMFMCLREFLSCLHVPKHSWIVKNFLLRIEENLNGFRIFLRRLIDLPEYVLHFSAQTQGDKCTEASYHLFHVQLDMLWLHLTSVYLVEQCRRATADDNTASQCSQTTSLSISTNKMDRNIVSLIAELIQLSLLRFEKTDVRSLLIKSPFSCTCVAELWIMVAMMANHLHREGLSENFWCLFNKVMEDFLKSDRPSQKPNCRTVEQSVNRPCSNPYGFALWFLKHIAMIHVHNEKHRNSAPADNYSLLETCMKGLLSSDVSEAHLRVYLTFVEKIIIKYWEPDPKAIILLWEYFQRRLNSTFYVPGSSVDSIAVMSPSVAGMVTQVRSRLSGIGNTGCENSFQKFLRIIGLYLQRVSASGQSQHWNQIRGRIYSKLSPSKINSLNATGLHHLVALFLTLAVTADLSDVSKKLQSLLASLPESESDVGVRQLVWRAHLSICLLLAERGHDITTALAPISESLSRPHADISLYRTYCEGVKDVMDSSNILKVDYASLVGAWIPKYLADCSPNDSSRLLDTLEMLMSRVQSQPNNHEKLQSSLWQHLGPYLRQRVTEENAPPQLADVCLRLCLPHWEIGRDLVHLMLLNNTTHISLVKRFLLKLIENDEISSNLKAAHPSSPESHEVLIIKSWVRCSLLSVDNTGELSRVTNYITELPFIANIYMDLPSANDPLVHFIVSISNKYKTQDVVERSSMRQLMSRVLTGLDKWVEPHVRQPQSSELTSRIYHIVGLVVQLLPTFIYMKSRPNTVLKGVLDVMLLPQAAYKPGYDPPLKAVIAKELLLYINGLADLSMMQDGYIDRCIQDLVRIYVPLVSSHSQCRLHECVQRADKAVRLVLDTICFAFIKRKTANPQPHCSQALKFLRSVAKLYNRNAVVMLMFVNHCFEHICDVIMFCDDIHHTKNIAREVMVSVFESNSFGDDLSVHILQKFDNLCREYLPFSPKKLFGFFLEVLKHRPELILRYLPNILAHVRTVEEKRGIVHDHSLRVYVGELENALKNIRKGPS